MIDDTKLAEWQALCDAAMTGPWHAKNSRVNEPAVGIYGVDKSIDGEDSIGQVGLMNFRNNAEFIAAARTALPEAIAEIRRLQADLRSAIFCIERASVNHEGCRSPWCDSGGGHHDGRCEGDVGTHEFISRLRVENGFT